MNKEIRLEHAGYIICATGIQLINRAWKCVFIILRNDMPLLSGTTIMPLETKNAAEQNAIMIAKRIVDEEVSEANT